MVILMSAVVNLFLMLVKYEAEDSIDRPRLCASLEPLRRAQVKANPLLINTIMGHP